MNYKEFVDHMVEVLHEKMEDGYEIKTTTVTKNNDIRLTGVVMMRKSDTISPTIYLEEPYRQYCMGADIHSIADQIVELYRERKRDIHPDLSLFREFDHVRDKIYHKIVHYDKNRNLLKDVPHIRWCDLAVVFYYAVEENMPARASILIRNEHMDMWRQTPDGLFQIAQDNMRRSMPDILVPLPDIIEEMTGERPEPASVTDLYVLTNRDKLYGASAMLYSDKAKELADRLGADLLILPSSVHEVLILPDDQTQEYDFYRNMVKEVNTTQVEPEEILSYSLYRYSREKEEIVEICV